MRPPRRCTGTKPWDRVLDLDAKPGAALVPLVAGSTPVSNAVDRHVEAGRGDQAALIYDSPVTGQKDLLYTSCAMRLPRSPVPCARGVIKGDRVLIYMPMIRRRRSRCWRRPAWVPCIPWCSVDSPPMSWRPGSTMRNRRSSSVHPAGSAEPRRGLQAIARRGNEDIGAQTIGVHHQEQGRRPEAPLIEGRDLDWDAASLRAQPTECVAVEATDPLYILYTSVPRATQGRGARQRWSCGGHALDHEAHL